MKALKVGDKAPDFVLPDAEGKQIKLSEFKGKYVVLYFYPKDHTPGCTKEACDFRDRHSEFENVNAVILGISKDTSQSHTNFISKYGLPFILLSDTAGEVLNAYNVWQPKTVMGRVGLGIVRTTVVIGPDGKIIKIYPKVKVAGHVADVLNDLKNLG